MPQNAPFQHNKELLRAGALRFGLGMVILGLFLFLCAGSLRYWNAWLYIGALSAAILCFGIILYTRDQELMRKRLQTREKEEAQKAYVLMTSLSFLATFGVCGFDFRFGWSHVPVAVVVIALAVMLAGFGLFMLVLMQNRFASRVVEVQQEQRVIDTGVYAVVRHPMYTAALLMFFASPVVLGSWWAKLPMLCYLVGIVLRIRNEEQVLQAGLPGYAAYMEKVKYRLVPFVW